MKNLDKEIYEKVTKKVLKKYQEYMKDFLLKYQGKITEVDAYLGITNVSLMIASNIFASIKNFVPYAPIDDKQIVKELSKRFETTLLNMNSGEK